MDTVTLQEDRILELETEAGIKPYYNGIVVIKDTLLTIDNKAWNLQIYNRHDGKLLSTSSTLDARPTGVCVINETEIAVCLSNSLIVIISWKSIDEPKPVKTLNINTRNSICYSVAKLKSDTLIVSGRENDDYGMLWWGVVNITDGRLRSSHYICKGVNAFLHIAVKGRTIVISCRTLNSITNGVYAYDISSPQKRKFFYQHSELKMPWTIMADSDYVYVIDKKSNNIHQLTDSGQLVKVYTTASRIHEVFFDDEEGALYCTHGFESNKISEYKLHSHQPGLPMEILAQDTRSIEIFKEALKRGKEVVHNIRIMVVGQLGVGKTTLVKRLLGEKVDIYHRRSTEGIDVHVKCCDVSVSTSEWTRRTKGQDNELERIAKVVNEQISEKSRDTDDQDSLEEYLTGDLVNDLADIDDQDFSSELDILQDSSSYVNKQNKSHEGQLNESTNYEEDDSTVHHKDTPFDLQQVPTALQQDKSPSQLPEIPTSELPQNSTSQMQETSTAHLQQISSALQEDKSTSHQQEKHSSAVPEETPTQIKTIALMKSVKEKINKREAKDKNSLLSIWDFAGQYVYYTTHQTFLTRRAIYLLVLDISGKVTDMVDDECYFDSDGVIKRKVHELVEIWLNSIHTCALSHDDGNPPVILVGTHVDKLPQDKRKEICDGYFKEIRSYLEGKVSGVHLIDEDFAIDNTENSKEKSLEDLKKKIVEIASDQPFWGEEIPASWLALEQELMSHKANGVKVIPRKEVEEINKDGTVPIETSKELDAFLKFLHDTGTIIYFNIEKLRENILLDPMFLIDALKFLINAEPALPSISTDSDTTASSPTNSVIKQHWCDFKGKGILTSQLIDAVWTSEKQETKELHAHKDYLLSVIVQLNIIAIPMIFSETGVEETKDYFLTPCMLRNKSPEEVTSTEQGPLVVSTPVLCFVFTEEFLPPPIFHRLVAACITCWPVAKENDSSEYLIFCGCCIFSLDLFHRLILHCKNHVVFARITRLVDDEEKVKSPDVKLCTRVRRFIARQLSEITSYLGQDLKHELCTWWSPSQVVSEHGRAASFQMWCTDVAHDSDGPIKPEHMYHARICVALMTVCADALRDILLTHVPAPHANIYQAILANKRKLTVKEKKKKGQEVQKTLESHQKDVVFPDPNNCYVGCVDQFDITLLSYLIRNVSSVPAPRVGWVNDESKLLVTDTSLGDSVVRIRSCRNQIGHSMNGEMSKQKFEKYWVKLNAVLEAIEQELCRQGYREQLEKHRKQVISVYEAS